MKQGFPDSKPAVTDVGLGPDTSKIGSKPDTSKIGAATKGHLEQAEPLLSHKAHENKAVHGTGMGLPNSAQDTVSAHSWLLNLVTDLVLKILLLTYDVGVDES